MVSTGAVAAASSRRWRSAQVGGRGRDRVVGGGRPGGGGERRDGEAQISSICIEDVG